MTSATMLYDLGLVVIIRLRRRGTSLSNGLSPAHVEKYGVNSSKPSSTAQSLTTLPNPAHPRPTAVSLSMPTLQARDFAVVPSTHLVEVHGEQQQAAFDCPVPYHSDKPHTNHSCCRCCCCRCCPCRKGTSLLSPAHTLWRCGVSSSRPSSTA
jgi:hypothetical protein